MVLGEYKMSEIKIRTIRVENEKVAVMVGNGRVALVEGMSVGVIATGDRVSLVGGIRELQRFVVEVCDECWARDPEVLVSGGVNEPVPPIIEVTCWAKESPWAPRGCCRRG